MSTEDRITWAKSLPEPLMDDLVESVCSMLRYTIELNTSKPSEETVDCAFLNESNYTRLIQHKTPSLEEMKFLVGRAMGLTKFDQSILVVALIYIDRLINKLRLQLTSSNWRTVFLLALLTAQKCYVDHPFQNVDFNIIYPSLTSGNYSSMESLWLEMLDWDLLVSTEVYDSKWLDVRSSIYACIETPRIALSARRIEDFNSHSAPRTKHCQEAAVIIVQSRPHSSQHHHHQHHHHKQHRHQQRRPVYYTQPPVVLQQCAVQYEQSFPFRWPAGFQVVSYYNFHHVS